MKKTSYLFICFIIFACQKEAIIHSCQLMKFVTEYPATNLIHHDIITLNGKQIVKVYSYDLKNKIDTAGRNIIIYLYNNVGKVLTFKDESIIGRVNTFDVQYNTDGQAIKFTQTINGFVNDEINIAYDAKKRPLSAVSQKLLGVNRSIEYDANGNPVRILVSDFGNLPVIYESNFDDKRNFFAGIPDIGLYWLIRPLYAYCPFGPNNVIGTKFYNQQGSTFKEVPDIRTKREIVYNEYGFPTSLNIFLENQNNAIVSSSKFEYKCE